MGDWCALKNRRLTRDCFASTFSTPQKDSKGSAILSDPGIESQFTILNLNKIDLLWSQYTLNGKLWKNETQLFALSPRIAETRQSFFLGLLIYGEQSPKIPGLSASSSLFCFNGSSYNLAGILGFQAYF